MPAEPTAARLQRILVMAPWVIAHGSPTVQEVCERFALTPEELAQDLDLLLVCGLPPFGPGDMVEAWIEEDRVIIRMAEWLSRPMKLTQREALALLVSGRAIAKLPGLEEADSLRRALAKLESALPEKDARAATELAGLVEVELDESGAGSLSVLREAISNRRRIEIEYFSYGRNEMTTRKVDPLLVFSALGRWYLVANDLASGEERFFRTDRIKRIGDAGETFERPADLDIESYKRRPLFTPSEEDLEVTLDLEPAAAWVIETVPYERLDEVDGGRRRLTLRTPHLAWLVRMLLSLGDQARVVKPDELVLAVRETATRALARYRP